MYFIILFFLLFQVNEFEVIEKYMIEFSFGIPDCND